MKIDWDKQFSNLAVVLKQTCSSASGTPDRAIARNLLCDHRISPARFAPVWTGATDGDMRAVESVLRDHRDFHVCPLKKSGRVPAYAGPENEVNALPPDKEVALATVVNLTCLGSTFASARTAFRIPELSDFEGINPKDATVVNKILSDRFRDLAGRAQVLEYLLKACARYRRSAMLEKHVRLTWAAEWDSAKPFLIRGQPQRWLQAVGVPTDTAAWVAVMKYGTKRGRTTIPLFRPTQLDAGWFVHHFPSPPPAPLEIGGHTMFLEPDGEDKDGYGLVREFIHQRVDFTIKDWESGGSLLELIDLPVGGSLQQQREKHLARMEGSYPGGVKSWMPECL